MILVAIIYLAGYVAAYLSGRWYITWGDMSIWTVGDRRIELLCSLLSWVWVLVNVLSIVVWRDNSGKPAKW